MHRAGITRVAVVVATAALLAASCSEERAPTESAATTVPAAAVDCEDLLACARASSIGDVVPADVAPAEGAPIVIGMINQENTALGSFPELSGAARAAIELVNQDLGGVHGRPVQLEVCNTEFSPEGSTACGQRFAQEGVPLVLGGIDVFGNGIDTLADNGIPYVGGIPVSQPAVTSPTSFQWSGGTWGATIAFAEHAATQAGAERAAIVYGEFGPITQSATYGETTLHSLGVDDVAMIPYPITATDLSSPIQAAAAGDPDALIVLAADTGCEGAVDAIRNAAVDATVYLVGACAAPTIVDAIGAAEMEGIIVNVEGPIPRDVPDPDGSLYTAAMERYGQGTDPIGAGTVTFRSFMNLYQVLQGLPADGMTSEAIIEGLRTPVDAPSFMGHDWTCDGQQLAGLPALCSPQQILAEMQDGQPVQITDWIDVGAVYGEG